jgi:hypothetical protein
MATSGIAALGASAAGQQAMQTIGPHKHGKHHAASISDVDGQSSSVAAASSSGKPGSQIDISA